MKKFILKNGWLCFVFFSIGCFKPFSCDEWASNFRDDETFKLVLEKKYNSESRDVYFYGKDIESKKEIEYREGGGWLAHNFDKFQVGDTLIKDKGKYTIFIKRNGRTTSLLLECGGKIYVDK